MTQVSSFRLSCKCGVEKWRNYMITKIRSRSLSLDYQAVINMVGPADYSYKVYGNNATLIMDEDKDTITCIVHWATEAYTKNIAITIRDGPVYDDQEPGWTGDSRRPVYLTKQFQLFDDTVVPPQQISYNVSLRSLFPGNTSSSVMRVIVCIAIGVHGSTTLPVYVKAMSKVILNVTNPKEPWQDFTGDVDRDRIYIAYGGQCGIMALSYTTLETIGWVTGNNITANGTSLTVPFCGYAGDGSKAIGGLAALSSDIKQIVVDETSGDLYIADTGNSAVRKIEYSSGLISTVAGIGLSGYADDGGQADRAALNSPSGLAIAYQTDPKLPGGVHKTLYIADTGNNAVRKVLLTDVVMPTDSPTPAPTDVPTTEPTNLTRSL